MSTFLIHRFAIPVILVLSLLFDIFAMVRIYFRKNTIDPLLMHDFAPPSNGRLWNVRYNKTLLSNAAIPLVCIGILIGIYISSKYAMDLPVGKKGGVYHIVQTGRLSRIVKQIPSVYFDKSFLSQNNLFLG